MSKIGQLLEMMARGRETPSSAATLPQASGASMRSSMPPSLLDGISPALPATIRAIQMQTLAAQAGFDWPNINQVMDKLAEEMQEIQAEINQGAQHGRMEDEIGDLLFVCVNLARHARVDPEAALRSANAKFERRFRRIEALLMSQGRTPHDSTLDEMDALWDQAKKEEKSGALR